MTKTLACINMPKKGIHVLCMISSPSGRYNKGSIGGGVTRTINILKKWTDYGLHIETLEVSPAPSLLMKAYYKVHSVSIPIRVRRLFEAFIFLLLVQLKFLRAFQKGNLNFDIIVSATSNLSDIIPAFLISKLSEKPFVVSVLVLNYSRSPLVTYEMFRKKLGLGVFRSLLAVLSSLIVLKLLRHASAVFCLSEPVRKMLKAADFPDEVLYTTGCGVNTTLVDSIPSKLKVYDGVFMGRLEVEKGIKDLLQSWSLVTQLKRDARLLIIGDGSYLIHAKAEVRALNINPNVKFTGFITDDITKFSYLKQGKVFIFPSKSEGWGIAVAEAMACGLPIICYDIPTFRELFGDCPNVIRVRPGDVKSLASQVVHLLSNAGKLLEYSEISKKLAQNYDWDTVAKFELKVIENLCQNLKPYKISE